MRCQCEIKSIKNRFAYPANKEVRFRESAKKPASDNITTHKCSKRTHGLTSPLLLTHTRNVAKGKSMAPTQHGGRNRGEIEAMGAASHSITSTWHIAVFLDPEDVRYAIVMDSSICRFQESYDIAVITAISTLTVSFHWSHFR